MKAIPFTQFLRPDGRRADVEIERPDEIAALAYRIMSCGYRFECEHLRTGHASFTISNDEGDYAITVVPNGPQVPPAIDAMIWGFALRLFGEGEAWKTH